MYTLVTLSLALGASALVLPRSSCSFELTASGGQNGTIGQLSDGQNRIGGGLSPATFIIDNGGITDAAGSGCILTPSVKQFQCDQGVGPTYGFSIESNGTLEYSGSSIFYACPASDTEWNLYTTPVVGQLKCVEISLTASGCGAISNSTCVESPSTVTVSSISTMTISSVSTITVYDCAASTSAEVVGTSSPASVVSSVADISTPAAIQSASVGSVSPQSVPVETASLGSVLPIESTQIVTQASSTLIESSTASIESASLTDSAETITEASSTPTAPSIAESISTYTTLLVQSTSIVVVGQISSIFGETSVTQSTHTVVPVQATSSLTSQVTVPTNLISTGETTSVYGHSYVSPVSSTSTSTAAIVTAQTISTPIVASSTTLATSYHWSNTTTSGSVISSSAISSSAIALTSAGASLSPSATTSSASTCVSTALTGTYTAGNYQYPHLIVPISSESPTTAAGTSYLGTISSNTSTVFNFDIPSSYSGTTCSLIFLLPLQSELETSSYTFSGSGAIGFEQLSTVATESTTWDTTGSVEEDLGTFTITEGSSTLIESFACTGGLTLSFEMKSGGGDTYLKFFQDYNPSPLGLYVTHC